MCGGKGVAWSDASREKQLVSNQGTVVSRFETSVSAKLPKLRKGEIQLLPDSVSNVEHHSVIHASWNVFFQCFSVHSFFEEKECFRGHLCSRSCQSERRQSGCAPRRLVLKHRKTKNETEPDRRRVHTKCDTRCTVSQRVRIKSLAMLRIWRGRKVARQGCLIDKFFGMWISTVEMMKERASCVERLISTVTRRAKKYGRWTNIDPLQRRPMFSGDLA